MKPSTNQATRELAVEVEDVVKLLESLGASEQAIAAGTATALAYGIHEQLARIADALERGGVAGLGPR